MSRALAVAALAAAAATPACIASSVVESSNRAVAIEVAPLDWHVAADADVAGIHESVSIEGEAAASVLCIWYSFASDGTYSGAALVVGAGNPEFQTLGGSWTLADGSLALGGGQLARAFAAEDHLKLVTEGGVVILRRSRVQ